MSTIKGIICRVAANVLFVTASLAFCQQLRGDIDVGKSSLEEIHQALKNKVPGYDAASFTSAAFKSRRIDILKLCWETPGTSYYFMPALQSLPDSPYKQDVLVMLLKSPSGQWMNGPSMGLSTTITSALAKDFLPMVQKYLPDTPVDFQVIATPERRLKLAEELEVAMRKDGVPQAGSKQAMTIETTAAAEIPKPPLPIQSPPSTSLVPMCAFWAVLGIIVLCVLLWISLKRRK